MVDEDESYSHISRKTAELILYESTHNMIFIAHGKRCRDCLLVIEESLILSGFQGFSREYVPVFLYDVNVDIASLCTGGKTIRGRSCEIRDSYECKLYKIPIK